MITQTERNAELMQYHQKEQDQLRHNCKLELMQAHRERDLLQAEIEMLQDEIAALIHQQQLPGCTFAREV